MPFETWEQRSARSGLFAPQKTYSPNTDEVRQASSSQQGTIVSVGVYTGRECPDLHTMMVQHTYVPFGANGDVPVLHWQRGAYSGYDLTGRDCFRTGSGGTMHSFPSERSDWVSMILEARRRILGFVVETPIILVEDSKRLGTARLCLKLEHLQNTGSFKLRGAANRVFALNDDEAVRGVITSSAGNHGLAVAAAARQRGIDVEVFLSAEVSSEKWQRIENYGARIRRVGTDHLESELAARADAEHSRRTYVSPYNDLLVIAGQGTIAHELTAQLGSFEAIYAAVGGGGLISGLGAYLKSSSSRVDVVGCWPENARTLYESLNVGHIIKCWEKPTLSESTAGGVEPGSITFDLCQQFVDRKILVSELEILEALRWAHGRGWVVEGAAGVAIASFLKEVGRYQGKTVVVVCCGGNISLEVRKQL
jgi:threonine dehydratase